MIGNQLGCLISDSTDLPICFSRFQLTAVFLPFHQIPTISASAWEYSAFFLLNKAFSSYLVFIRVIRLVFLLCLRVLLLLLLCLRLFLPCLRLFVLLCLCLLLGLRLLLGLGVLTRRRRRR